MAGRTLVRLDADNINNLGGQIQGQIVALTALTDLSNRGGQIRADDTLLLDAGRDPTLTAAQIENLGPSTGLYGFALALLLRERKARSQGGGTSTGIGSSAVSDTPTTVSAGRNLTLESATETRNDTHQQSVSTSGLFSGGGLGITLGTQKLSSDSTNQGTTALASTVGSLTGNVTLLAGQHYRQTGSDILAPGGDITIQAQDIRINEARETRRSETKTEFQQSGRTLALTSPVISAVQTLQQQSRAASNTSDSCMQMLAAANAGFAAKNAYDAIQAGQGTTIKRAASI